MSEIYQCAALTLAATVSLSDSEGCYSEEMRPSHIEIPTPENSADRPQLALRKVLDHWDRLAANQIPREFPLLSRAWAFQERLLSRRILHFCTSELVWECRELTECECGFIIETTSPCGQYFNIVKSSENARQEAIDLQGELDLLFAQQLLETEEAEERDHSGKSTETERVQGVNKIEEFKADEDTKDEDWSGHRYDNLEEPISRFGVDAPLNHLERRIGINDVEHFHRLLEQYTRLRLTRPSDRLPALSGLCRRVQGLRGEYCAGLWYNSIAFDLMWRVNTIDSDAGNAGRPLQYRGPSWSWVSVESAVTYWPDTGDLYYRPDGFRIEASVDVVGKNPFGEIRSALLTIESSSAPAILEYTYDADWHLQTGALKSTLYTLKVRFSAHLGGDDFFVEVPFFVDYALAADERHQIGKTETVEALLLHPQVALILRRKDSEILPADHDTLWQRIGIARLSDTMVNEYNMDWRSSATFGKYNIV